MSGRDIDADLKTASQQPLIYPIILVKLEYDGGDVVVHSGIGNVTYNGDTYLGVGNFGKISPVFEDNELASSYVDLELSGIETAYISNVLNEDMQGRPATIYFGLLNTTTRALINPTKVFDGLMDFSDISLGETATIKIRVNNEFALWDRPNESRYNDADQQALYPGDLAFQFVETLTEQTLVWGRADE